MTKEQIEIAFQKYQTIQNPNSGSVDSFGLGLPITKQIVELQNGKLEVKSQPSQGTEMKLKFPYLM
jgi:signal transduction histidine kinase